MLSALPTSVEWSLISSDEPEPSWLEPGLELNNFQLGLGISPLRLENGQNTRLFLSTLLFLPIGKIVLNSECTWLNIISLVASKKSDKKKGRKKGLGSPLNLKKSQDFWTPLVPGLFGSTRFQLGNWSAPARLGSARNLYSLGSLEPENSSSNSSLVFMALHTKNHNFFLCL